MKNGPIVNKLKKQRNADFRLIAIIIMKGPLEIFISEKSLSPTEIFQWWSRFVKNTTTSALMLENEVLEWVTQGSVLGSWKIAKNEKQVVFLLTPFYTFLLLFLAHIVY